MLSFLKQLKFLIEDHSPRGYSIILAVPIIFFVTGFFIWNIYLYSFGFVDNELLRAKFILAGLLFILITFIFWMIVDGIFSAIFYILKSIKRYIYSVMGYEIKRPKSNNIKITFFILIFISWFFVYIFIIFPFLPTAIGGGQPRSISLIATETMPTLNSLQVKLGAGATNQTENLCVVHEDSQGIYILREDRVLMLDRSLFRGFGSLPGTKTVYEQICIQYAKQWSLQGILFSYLLLKTQVENLFRPIFGYPQKYFEIL